MKFENTQVMNFEGALRGMRNPMNSWNKSDSGYYDENDGLVYDKPSSLNDKYIIGEDDLKLAQRLIYAGSEHRKFMRQIFVCVDITAPLYWWKEFDTYKVGTVANSTSTMHKLATTPITKECFDIDDFDLLNNSFCTILTNGTLPENPIRTINYSHANWCDTVVAYLERLREKYLETKDKKYWKELIRWLPESWLQTRTVTFNYENLLAMCSKGQRRFHKLNEWSGQDNPSLPNFISWARSLPYAQELIFIDELEDNINV